MKNKKLVWGIVVVVIIIFGVLLFVTTSCGCADQFPVTDINKTPQATPTPTPVVSSSPIKTPIPITSIVPATPQVTLKSYTDPELKVTVNYPADWQLLAGEPGPNYSFWFTHKIGAEMASVFRVARTDGCRPDNPVTIDGQKAYDSGWQSLATLPSRKICLIDKKILLDLTARNEQARGNEDLMLSNIKFGN